MNEIPELQTVSSCQGEPTECEDGTVRYAFVYFYFGDWKQISRLAFNEMAPALSGLGSVQVDQPGTGDPIGKVIILPGCLSQGIDVLLHVLNRHRTPCLDGTVRTELRNY